MLWNSLQKKRRGACDTWEHLEDEFYFQGEMKLTETCCFTFEKFMIKILKA